MIKGLRVRFDEENKKRSLYIEALCVRHNQKIEQHKNVYHDNKFVFIKSIGQYCRYACIFNWEKSGCFEG